MYKVVLLMTVVLSGCANFTVNSSMCDNIGTGSDANMGDIPRECRDYNKKDADKAFHKVVEEKKVADKDIKFDKEEE